VPDRSRGARSFTLEQPQVGLGGHGEGGENQHPAEGQEQRLLELRAVAEHPEQERAGEGARDGSDAEPLHDAQVDGAASQVNEPSDRLHEETGHHVAGHRRERCHSEEEDQHRRHERTAAHAGEADDQPDEKPGHRDCGVPPVHAPFPSPSGLGEKAAPRAWLGGEAT
jgi:hypothetical protein